MALYYVVFDPGESIGVAGYDNEGKLQWMHTIKLDKLTAFLNEFCMDNPKLFLIEEYRVYPHKAQSHINSKLNTTRAIGKIAAHAERLDIKIEYQEAHLKKTGYKWMGRKPLPKSNPLNHALDAHAHGIYYLVKHKVINLKDL